MDKTLKLDILKRAIVSQLIPFNHTSKFRYNLCAKFKALRKFWIYRENGADKFKVAKSNT